MLLLQLTSYIAKVRDQFPRLYFLSDQELVAMLGISRNAPALLPYVKKCFMGIEDLTFSLPNEEAHASSLDYALNGEQEPFSFILNNEGLNIL